MKITKTQLRQIIKEEIMKETSLKWPIPVGSNPDPESERADREHQDMMQRMETGTEETDANDRLVMEIHGAIIAHIGYEKDFGRAVTEGDVVAALDEVKVMFSGDQQ
jgi:hypothetical protein